jgi:hypothetical protein
MPVPSDGKAFYSKNYAASHRQSGEAAFEPNRIRSPPTSPVAYLAMPASRLSRSSLIRFPE